MIIHEKIYPTNSSPINLKAHGNIRMLPPITHNAISPQTFMYMVIFNEPNSDQMDPHKKQKGGFRSV
jgi:hypothetical protein